MKTKSEITDFYYKELYPSLKVLEEERKKIKKKLLTQATFLLLFVIIAILYIVSTHAAIELIFFIVTLSIIIASFIYKHTIKEYAIDFKSTIIEPLIKEIESSFQYYPYRYIDPIHFQRSQFSTEDPDKISGNDLVKGDVDGVPIMFSDLHAEKEHKDSKGRTSWTTLFQGLFIVTEFPKKFHGDTTILPDTAQNIFGDYLGNILQNSNFSRNKLVKMDNPEFEKKFVVYASDQIEARYILSPAFMQRVLLFEKRTKQAIYISFHQNKMYLGIAYNKDMFEPSVFRSLLEYKIAMEYIDTLHLTIGIVKELKLNQKIWSKI
jgi:uncharacterized protein YebE (UPF0316 family)